MRKSEQSIHETRTEDEGTQGLVEKREISYAFMFCLYLIEAYNL